MQVNEPNKIRANLIIISSPSGGGKTSLIKELTQTMDNIKISISHTTRNKRLGEEHGKDYFFVSKQDFFKLQQSQVFLEHAEVFTNYYGTSIQAINQNLQSGIDTILPIDWQGARQIKTEMPQAISIFILPPSIAVLKERLYTRNLDSPEVMLMRMEAAQDEISHYPEYDFVVVNEDFTQAVLDLKTIILAHRFRTSIQQQNLIKY